MRKVLIVDDDLTNIFALSEMLKSRGWDPVSATSAKAALHFLRTDESIGPVLLDMMMPGIDGYEMIGMVRQTPAIRRKRLIAVTAQAMAGDRERCLAAGADEYISKPIDVDRLFALLNQYTMEYDG